MAFSPSASSSASTLGPSNGPMRALVERVVEPEQLLRMSAQLIGDKLSEVFMRTVRSQPSPEGDGRDTNHTDTDTHERSLHECLASGAYGL